VVRYSDIRQQDSAETIHAKLDESLHSTLGFSREVVGASEAIMGVQHADHEHQEGASSQKVLSRLQRALVRNIINAAKDAPLYVLVEDVHWMDASTEGLIRLLVARVRRKKIFLMLTSRPQRVPSFDFPHVTNLTLGKLEDDAVSELVANVFESGDQTIDQSALMSTIGKCEGNPLFVEELSKHYLEQKSPDSIAVAHKSKGDDLPVMLQASLLARIDTAGEGKEIAQLASVIGREFDRDILVKLAEQPEDDVDAMLGQLGALGILSPNTFKDRAFFAFRHALLREAVYSSLLSKPRQAVHLRVAHLLVDARQTYSAETIARHFEHGGDHGNAFGYWREAGQHALDSGATTEAVNLLASALRMARHMSERDKRLDDLASANLSYALALNASHGVVAEPIKYFRKAEKLAARVNKTEMLLESLDWQFGMQFNAGKLGAAKGPAQKIKRLGVASGNPRALASGSQGLGMVHFMRGELNKARREFEQGLEAAADYVSGVHCFPSMSLSYLAWTYFILGESEKASSSAKRAIASAREESPESPHALATALSNCSYVFQCLGDVESVYACAAELVEHARKHGELMYLKRGVMTRKWADFVSGVEDHSIEAIRDHIELLLESKEEIEVTFHLGVLADLQIRKGRYEDALASINQALKIAHKNDEFFYVPELYRLKAHIYDAGPKVLSSGDDADYIAMAKATARAQKAKAWLDKLTVTPKAM
jgi:tetratricopeptide (TPR) repeat protein